MTQTAPNSRFRWFRSARPLTLFVMLAAVLLHLAVRLSITPENDRSAAYRAWGVLQVERSAEHSELSGPFDLWAGQWWRIPLGALHHRGWWHLALAGYAFVYLGWLLEPKLHPAVYGLFLLGACLMTTLPRWLGGESVPVWVMGGDPVIGLSGVAYAQFGCLLMLRRNDSQLADRFGEGAILIGMVVGLACLGFAIIPVAQGVDNLAHLAGLAYGLVWGQANLASPLRRGILVAVLILAHFSLWPIYQGLIHPVQNARYHWWLAESTEDETEKQAAYERALELDPSLEELWLELVEWKLETQGPKAAWETLLTGLRERGDLGSDKPMGEEIWAAFQRKEERRDAWREVERAFPENSMGLSRVLLSPRQAAQLFMERGEPLRAWAATMDVLKGVSPTSSFVQDEIPFAKQIWQQLEPGERQTALGILDQELDLRLREWHMALIPNRDLISHYQDQEELLWAWEALMAELKDDPAFREEGKQIARKIWQALPTELRRERARNLVNEVFGVNRLWWQVELDILSEAARNRYRLDQPVELSAEGLFDAISPSDRIRPLDPDNPESAALGISL